MGKVLKIQIEDEHTCGRHCPFLDYNLCFIFGDLDETQLPDGHEWNDEATPTRKRDSRCRDATE